MYFGPNKCGNSTWPEVCTHMAAVAVHSLSDHVVEPSLAVRRGPAAYPGEGKALRLGENSANVGPANLLHVASRSDGLDCRLDALIDTKRLFLELNLSFGHGHEIYCTLTDTESKEVKKKTSLAAPHILMRSLFKFYCFIFD